MDTWFYYQYRNNFFGNQLARKKLVVDNTFALFQCEFKNF